MNIITVIPLTRAKVAETLTYFTGSEAAVGAIVSVPLRSKTIHAIVAETRRADDVKMEIKKAPYEIRKLARVKATAFFPAPFMEAAKKLAHYYIGNIGAVIDALTANTLLENAAKIESPSAPQGLALSRRLNLESSTFAVQGDDEDRMSSWRSLIRQEFARKKSVAFYVPTIEDAEYVAAALTKGIEGYIFTLHGLLPKKKMLETWNTVGKCQHPVAIVLTSSFSILPRSDIDTVVIERENGRGWISQKAPYLDLRHAIETLAHAMGQVVYRADLLLRTETLRRLSLHEINQGSPFKWRSISLAKDILVDMTRKNDGAIFNHSEAKSANQTVNEIDSASPAEELPVSDGKTQEEKVPSRDPKKNPFKVISAELEDMIRRNIKESTHLFIYAARRGLSPVTVCDDCETIVSCANCRSPVVLHASKTNGLSAGGQSRNFFMCHVCGERSSADITCKNCGGWRLSPLGIGIERVEEEVRLMFPGIDIFKIDSDSTTTGKQIAEVLNKFKSKPGSILLGTELALAHIRERLDHGAIVSLDSLFSLPDFRIPDKIMYTVTRLRTLSTKSILVQTRRPLEKVFEYGLKGNLSDFYRDTLADRKQFDYPPFSTLVKVSIDGKKEPIAELMASIKKMIEPFEMDIFPAFTSTSRGSSIIHGLVRVESHLWPNTELIAKLRTLPLSVSVRVDPESLL